ncbi:MAG TPA: ADP-ribosylglycohydrolase family protein [Gemmatimonadales bacterium]
MPEGTSAPPDPQVVSRARGALLGLVAGNQIGVPTEKCGTPEAIREAFPDGVWDPAPPPKGSPYDDDAALALLLAESLIERGEFDAGDVAARWVKWMKVDGRGLAPQSRRALRLMERGIEPFEAGRRAAAESGGKNSDGGTCTVCGVPMALRYYASPDRLIRAATQQAALTHPDDRCLWAAAAVALGTRELIGGNPYFVDEVLHRIEDRAPRIVVEAARRALRASQEDLPLAKSGEGGPVVDGMEIAFWYATHARSLEDALVYLAQAGGNTGTNAALAGALLGARDGEVGIPPRWMGLIAGAEGVARLADRLVLRKD